MYACVFIHDVCMRACTLNLSKLRLMTCKVGLVVVVHRHLTWDACFLHPHPKSCGKLLAAKMRDETQERKAGDGEGGRKRRGCKARHLRYAEMEMSINNRKSEALLSKYGTWRSRRCSQR